MVNFHHFVKIGQNRKIKTIIYIKLYFLINHRTAITMAMFIFTVTQELSVFKS